MRRIEFNSLLFQCAEGIKTEIQPRSEEPDVMTPRVLFQGVSLKTLVFGACPGHAAV
jgi:hypothetical protein